MADENLDYYKALKQENYNALLDKEIQLDNARQRALRNTNTSLAAAGFASSGYGQTANLGIENQYLQGLQQAHKNYQDVNADYDKSIYSAMNNAYAGLNEDIANGQYATQEEFDKYLTDFGLMKDGVLNKEAFSAKYGADNFDNFNAKIQNIRDYLEKAATSDSSVDLEDTFKQVAVKATQDEYNFLTSSDGMKIFKNLKDGDVVKLSDNTGDSKNVFYKYVDGKLVEATREEYNKSGAKYWVRSSKNTKDMIVDYNGKTIYDKPTSNFKNFSKGAGIAGLVLGALGLNPIAILGGAATTAMGFGGKTKADENYEQYLKALQGK